MEKVQIPNRGNYRNNETSGQVIEIPEMKEDMKEYQKSSYIITSSLYK